LTLTGGRMIVNNHTIDLDPDRPGFYRVRPEGSFSDAKATWHLKLEDAIKVAELGIQGEDDGQGVLI
jgi:hypothetical protein